MSRHALILERANLENTLPSPSPVTIKSVPSSGEYSDLIRRLVQRRSVLAIVNSGSGSRGSEASRGIAAELAASGHRVVIVEVDSLLRMSHVPDPTACLAGRVPNVFRWPNTMGAPVEFFQSPGREPSAADWLASLRSDFDAVLLDCPTIEIAAMADAAVLVVEAGRTAKEQIHHDQRAFKLGGVKLAGAILMKRR